MVVFFVRLVKSTTIRINIVLSLLLVLRMVLMDSCRKCKYTNTHATVLIYLFTVWFL